MPLNKENSKIVINGDPSQIDLPNKNLSGLDRTKKILSHLDEISFGGDYIDMIRKVYLKPDLEKKERIEFIITDIERIKKFFNFEQIIRNETNYKLDKPSYIRT